MFNSLFNSNSSLDTSTQGRRAGFVAFLLVAFLSALIIWKIEDVSFEKKLSKAREIANESAYLIDNEINKKLALAYPFAAMLHQTDVIPDFEFIGEKLLLNFSLVSEIAIAPEGTITQVAPLKGNRQAIGLDLLDDPEQKAESLFAKETGKLTLAGPLNLVQGGKGLVGRLPVYVGKEKKFFGFVLVVIKFPDILEIARLKQVGYNYRLTRINPTSGEIDVIASSQNEELVHPIEKNIELPNVRWTLHITPIGGWHNTWMLTIEMFLGLLISLLVGYIAKQYFELQNNRTYLEKQVQKRTLEILKTKNNLRTLLNSIPDLVWLKDSNGIYMLCNPPFERFFGAKEEAIVGKSDYDFVDKELADFFRENDSSAMHNNGLSINEEWVTFADDGHSAFLETIKTPMYDEKGTLIGILGIARDITKRHKAEAHLSLVSQSYAALSQCNHIIIHAKNSNELFAKICESSVLQGGMSMAWIGIVDAQTKNIYPVASYGDENAYLHKIEISIRNDISSGRGPVGTAARENSPYWCQDFMNDSATIPWHERGAAVGWQSMAALPIHLSDEVIGVFAVYSKSLKHFDSSIQELLTEMASDISFAMENFDKEEKRKVSQERLVQTEKLLEEISTLAHVGGFEFDPRSKEGTWTAELARIYEVDNVNEINREIALSVFQGEWLEEIQTAVNEAINQAKPYDLELQMMTHKGNHKWVRTIGVPVVEEGSVICVRGSIQDITAQKLAEEKVYKLAHFDSLTGLPNRALLNEHVNDAISIADGSKTSLALLYVDLDRFKNINDSFGYTIGNELLVQVAERIKSIIGKENTLSRQAGDEFIILLSGIDINDIIYIVEKLIDNISQSYTLQNHNLTITPSIGIALYPSDGTDLASLAKSADGAMHGAKHDGRNCYRFVSPEIQARSVRNFEIENALRSALGRNELEVYYQPQISIDGEKIIGAEALLRWNHPEMGMVSPGEFIPVAEESGQIVAIGEWVLREALGQLKTWLDEGMKPLIMAVNLSAIQFRQAQLVPLILSILEELKLPAEYLELELTEGIAMENPLLAIEIMTHLHEYGIKMSIDDFGTGYSSLNYLKKFQVYKLKIDQSFIQDVTENPEDNSIVNTIISMARNLKMITIAEGVETAEQLETLREMGCDEIQGYYYSKPLRAAAFKEFVKSHRD
jgi:diguanylate cyclase (GGDEF)-like protein/PAS domain S-box-containing protein